jgi:hypothetical protein
MAMPTPDLIANMSYLELDSLAKSIAERMQQLRENGLEQLHDELESKANDLGYSLAELIAIAKKKRRRPRARTDNGASVHTD